MKNEPFLHELDDLPWQSTLHEPGVRWKFLVDADHTPSHGISLGSLELDPGAKLPPHHHAPQEIYLVHTGTGQMRLGDDVHAVRPGSVIYIPENCTHGIENTSASTLAFYWFFPTDTWAEIQYIYDEA